MSLLKEKSRLQEYVFWCHFDDEEQRESFMNGKVANCLIRNRANLIQAEFGKTPREIALSNDEELMKKFNDWLIAALSAGY